MAVTQLFVSIVPADRGNDARPIANEAEAVAHALDQNRTGLPVQFFRTFEVTSTDVGGETLKGACKNYSPNRYVGVAKVFTRDEALAALDKTLATYPKAQPKMPAGDPRYVQTLRPPAPEVYDERRRGPSAETQDRQARASIAKKPAETIYRFYGRDFLEVKSDEKVFDHTGTQIWPAPTPPQVKPAANKQPTP